MARAVSLAVVLSCVWLLLSGHTEPLLLVLGAISVAFAVFIAHRMDVVDREGHPIHLGWRAPLNWAWLWWEIVKANIDVAKRVVSPGLPISPTVFRTAATQKSALGRVTYANFITLTPGTVSLEVGPDYIEVHALSRDAAESLMEGTMDRKVTTFMGER